MECPVTYRYGRSGGHPSLGPGRGGGSGDRVGTQMGLTFTSSLSRLEQGSCLCPCFPIWEVEVGVPLCIGVRFSWGQSS